jgi:DegV family protein with EDD domain
MNVGIVCDSTCDLGPEYLAERGVVMVPLTVRFGEETFRDWVELRPEAFFERLLVAPELPKTSQPSPADFTEVYERLAREGCEEIVSIHLSSGVSGTVDSATLAAATSPVPVRVVDTKLVSVATAMCILAAATARDAGGAADAVEGAAREVMTSARLFFVLDTLDYLVKGGRAGKAQALAASILNIKPILTFNDDGIIEPYQKVKGFKKAVTSLAADIAREAHGRKVNIGFIHTGEPSSLDEMKAALDATGLRYEVVATSHVGAVIGTYAGPGAIGVASTFYDAF